VIGAAWRFEQALRDSEGSSKLNTSFIERLNLTIRQGSAHLLRQTICHAKWKERIEDRLELLRGYYNFVRPHRVLKFGREVRTRAMQLIDNQEADVQGDFRRTNTFWGAAICHVRVLLFRFFRRRGRFALFYGCMPTLRRGSTSLCRSRILAIRGAFQTRIKPAVYRKKLLISMAIIPIRLDLFADLGHCFRRLPE